jgi:hypothetical protein
VELLGTVQLADHGTNHHRPHEGAGGVEMLTGTVCLPAPCGEGWGGGQGAEGVAGCIPSL